MISSLASIGGSAFLDKMAQVSEDLLFSRSSCYCRLAEAHHFNSESFARVRACKLRLQRPISWILHDIISGHGPPGGHLWYNSAPP